MTEENLQNGNENDKQASGNVISAQDRFAGTGGAGSEQKENTAGDTQNKNTAGGAKTANPTNKKPQIILASGSPRRLELLKKAGINPKVLVSNVDETLPLDLKGHPKESVQFLAQHKVQAVVTELLLDMDDSFQQSAFANKQAGAGFIVTRFDENDAYLQLPYLVIGADTMVVLNGETYGKPRDAAHAKEILTALSGNTHVVMTGVSMWFVYEDESAAAAGSSAQNGVEAAGEQDEAEGVGVDAQASGEQDGAEDAAEEEAAHPDAFTPAINIGVISFVDESEVTFNKLTEEQIDEYIATGECFGKAGAYAAQGGGDALIQQIDGNVDTVIGLPVTRMLKDYAAVLGVDAN